MQRVIHNKHMNEHHAILIFADSLALSGIPDAYLEQGADVLHLIKDRFGIDDARELSEQASQTPFASSVRVFVIATNDVAVEAQNALLKLLEEPPQHARFYLILPPGSFLLPTLRSRLYEQEHTRMPVFFATIKCPHSCTRMSTNKTMKKRRMVIRYL